MEDYFDFKTTYNPNEEGEEGATNNRKNKSNGLGAITKRQYSGVCQNCKQIKYRINQISLELDATGTVTKWENLAKEFRRVHFAPVFTKEKRQAILTAEQIFNGIRKLSDFIFGRYNLTPEQSKRYQEQAQYWFFKSKADRIEKIKKLFQLAEQVMAAEPTVLEIESPCFMFGDIHGNLRDLITYERYFWPSAPFFVTNRFLFLGDYVDRGEYSIEVSCYLLALKVMMPDQFFLIRGNHEIREMQIGMTFQKECFNKFGFKDGLVIWEHCNKAFDQMPICAVVDDSIFCAHGGIPKSCLKLSIIKKIPKPMPSPDETSAIAVEILWNDVISEDKLKEVANKFDEVPERGFMNNALRGIGFVFWDQATDRFLQANNLSLIVRAHQYAHKGYNFNCKSKVITVFSSSFYGKNSNKAACLLVDEERVRVLQLETEKR